MNVQQCVEFHNLVAAKCEWDESYGAQVYHHG